MATAPKEYTIYYFQTWLLKDVLYKGSIAYLMHFSYMYKIPRHVASIKDILFRQKRQSLPLAYFVLHVQAHGVKMYKRGKIYLICGLFLHFTWVSSSINRVWRSFI